MCCDWATSHGGKDKRLGKCLIATNCEFGNCVEKKVEYL